MGRRNPNGAGSIRRLPSGRWQPRWTGPDGTRRSGPTQATKTAASDWLVQQRAAELNGEWRDLSGGNTPFEEWVDEWARHAHVTLRPSTLARDQSHLRARAIPAFGSTPLNALTHIGIKKWVTELTVDLAPATVLKHLQIVRKVLNEAVAAGLIASNPAARVSAPRVEVPDARHLTAAEVDQLAAVIDSRYRALVYVGAYCGPRIGELAALTRDDVDFEQGRLHISATVVEVHGKLVVNRPKTRAGVRSVPIPSAVADELAVHLDSHQSDQVFPSPNGQTLRPSLFRGRVFAPAARAAGLTPLTPHDLRHTAISLWILAGLEPKAVAVRAGHRSIVTVYDRYGHLYPESTTVADEALNRLARGSQSPPPATLPGSPSGS